MIIFYDNRHKESYNEICGRMKCLDNYHCSLAYLLSLEGVREHIADCFDFADDVIKVECLKSSWQTSTSLKTTHLAFNLWNGCCDDGEEYTDNDGYKVPLPSSKYAVDEIFSSSLAVYYWQAIMLRFGLTSD